MSSARPPRAKAARARRSGNPRKGAVDASATGEEQSDVCEVDYPPIRPRSGSDWQRTREPTTRQAMEPRAVAGPANAGAVERDRGHCRGSGLAPAGAARRSDRRARRARGGWRRQSGAGRRPHRASAERAASRPQQAHQCADLRAHPAPEIILALGVVRREAAAAGAPPGASSGASGGARRAAPGRPRPPPRRRRPPHGNGRGPHSAPAAACPIRGSAHERRSRGSACSAACGMLLGRPRRAHRCANSIAELVQEAADAQQAPGEPPELDRHERLLIANVLRLRETTADDVMVPRADIVAMRADADPGSRRSS